MRREDIEAEWCMDRADDDRGAEPKTVRSVNATTSANFEVIDVQHLFKGNDQVDLLHNGELYRLRVTSKGRLILTK